MKKKAKVVINGRFLTGPQTGVQRTAHEMVVALDELIGSDEISQTQISFVLLYNGSIKNPIALKHIVLKRKGFLKGNLWEQLELPIYSFGCLLVNMCTIAPLFKRRQIVFIHDVSFLVNKDFFSRGFRFWYTMAIPLLGKLAKAIVTVSMFSKKELVDLAGVDPQKITVIYNAAEHMLRFEAPNLHFMDKINKLKPYCLAVSSLGANKNFKGLTMAMKGMAMGKYQLVIAGGGVSALNNELPNEDANYLGFVSDEELVYLYRNAALFIFPSFYEGFGIPPLEAMLLGCPVIAANTSSMPEVLGHACAYLDPYNPAIMRKNIFELINDPHRLESLKQKGYGQVAKYSWQKSALQLYDLIENCNA
ncbi:glycosyltransferase family 1 protein [Pedobacter chinensis]|uniref:Glycosyltransferase family 1 protein n=1 Tax=Pedobacter chinensis TaxID=2282421 RepID=A0A369PTD9_9SPHI|nr:glycosyltransferase family 1 protein [Pedobacter chinensis]RDC55833.1 glycosyltransferase family 1 protein [Pedobacter chinensis]